ncbi:hypothetical protein PVK06_022305 [Gossypium arboreum]|uniref:RNase H type-1 domain-containing protein n=1 Tax=Gossypium arboreum TaxID=29729 RepID=A0ABR0P836_GOSAR|nr:hypothetical protein PVK06_022305 [Gossypium arboreum]
MGLGIIVRDEYGFVLGGYGCTKEKSFNSDWAEIMAIEEGIFLAKKMNIKKVLFESDNANIVNNINSKGQDITFIGQRANDIHLQLKSFEAAAVTWAPRSSNRIADFICKFVLKSNCKWVIDVNYPSEIHELVIQDVINGS